MTLKMSNFKTHVIRVALTLLTCLRISSEYFEVSKLDSTSLLCLFCNYFSMRYVIYAGIISGTFTMPKIFFYGSKKVGL